MRSFQWRVTIPLIVFIIICMAGLGIYLSGYVKSSQIDNLRFHLEQEAVLTSEAVLPSLLGQGEAPDVLAKKLGGEIDNRITFIAPDGTVLGDSFEDPSVMENHAGRPEVRDALSAGIGESTRYSITLDRQMMYVAVPVKDRDEVVGIARVALPVAEVEQNVGHVTRTVGLATVIIAALVVLAVWLITRTMTKPIRQLTRAAISIAGGQLGQKIIIGTKDETGQLAHAFNEMSSSLESMVETISSERSRLSGILANMADGVVMTDVDGCIVLANAAAGRIFTFAESASAGRPLIELVRDHEVDDILKACLQTGEEQASQFESGIARRFLRAIAVPLLDQGRLHGVLLLFQDLTEMRNLQTMRRELVGNISHDLRTPIAGIKAMVETLLDGAIDDKRVSRDFLSRIQAETDRLAQMVSELTQLSRIESGQAELDMESVNLNALAEDVLKEMGPLAQRRQVSLSSELSPGLPSVRADRERIRQTIVNLVHNAIKFNRPGGKVAVVTGYDDRDVTVSVTDTGIGISRDVLPHVFERFYKADKSRSGGGSGLGLAIARHTVQSHGGSISARSEEDKGSAFTFSLPRQYSSPNLT